MRSVKANKVDKDLAHSGKAFSSAGLGAPLAISAIIHLLLISTLFLSFSSKPEPKRLKPPNFVKATLVQLDAKTSRPAPQVAAPPKKEERDSVAEEERKAQERKAREQARKAEEQKAEAKKQALEKKKKAEKERAEKEREKKEKAAKEKAQREKDRLLKEKEEAEKKAAEQRRLEQLQAEQEAMLAEQYATQVQSVEQTIYQRITNKWNQPPSARNGMRTELSISLLPNGMVTDVSILKSSGNEAFDRSAVAAVRAVENFREVKDLPIEIFNRNFRPLYIDFNPQNLRL